MNFIVKLSKSKNPTTEKEYDSIMIVVNRLIKWTYFISYQENMRAEETAYLFEWHIIANHETSTEIITNRDIRFRATFWKTLMSSREIKIKMSISEHAQTDRQTERLNQILEQYLWCYVNYQQDNWIKWLSRAQFAYNNSIHSSTEMTSFFAEYEREMMTQQTALITESKNDKARLTENEQQQVYKQL